MCQCCINPKLDDLILNLINRLKLLSKMCLNTTCHQIIGTQNEYML
jgi:hypothetical protein